MQSIHPEMCVLIMNRFRLRGSKAWIFSVRKILRCRFDLFWSRIALALSHYKPRQEERFRTFTRTALEICELLNDVRSGKSSEAGVFRATLTIWQMTVGTGEDVGLTAVRNDIRKRGVPVRMPSRAH